jgi:hypothetical protein
MFTPEKELSGHTLAVKCPFQPVGADLRTDEEMRRAQDCRRDLPVVGGNKGESPPFYVTWPKAKKGYLF